MNYRLLALDLDGTLLDDNLQIRRDSIEAINRVRAQGVQVMLVTGRHHVTAYPYWHELGLSLPAICCNGVYVYDFQQQRPLAKNPMTRPEARALLALVRQFDMHSMIYVDDAVAYETEGTHPPFISTWAETLPVHLRPRLDRVDSFERLIEEAPTLWKFTTASDDTQRIEAFVDEIERTLGLACELSGAFRLDIARAGNSKGARLAEWIAEQGIKKEEVIAFGDQYNDLEMLRLAGVGIAMENGVAKLRACADWVTGRNNSDGIAQALNRFIPASRELGHG